MLKLSLDALQIVDAIDRGGSFAAAAKELYRVPSTISYAVAKLEEDLGTRIFDRAGPRVELTPAGQALLADGRELLLAAQHLELKVRRVASGWEAEFSIALDVMLSPSLFIEEITAFYTVADSTRLRFSHEVLSGTWEALLDRRVDLVIGAAGEGPAGGGYHTERIGTIDFVFVVAPSHPLAAIDRPLTKADLIAHRMIAVGDSARRLAPRTVGLLAGQDTLTMPNIAEKFRFQLAGLGAGFMPEAWARPAITAGKLIEKTIEEKRAPETIYLAWRTGERGAALEWWLNKLRHADMAARLSASLAP